MSSEIYTQVADLHAQIKPDEVRLATATDELHTMQASINARPYDIREQKRTVQELEAWLEPRHERIEQLEAMLPGPEEVAAAKKKVAALLKAIVQQERIHAATLREELLPGLERLVEVARKLNTTKRQRLDLTSEIRQLRKDFNLDDLHQRFENFPEVEEQKLASLLASFLKDSIYGLPREVVERDLAAIKTVA